MNHRLQWRILMSFKPEVIADSSGKWTPNQLRFATEAEAKVWNDDLALRWTLVRDTRVVECDDPVNARMDKVGEHTWQLVHLDLPGDETRGSAMKPLMLAAALLAAATAAQAADDYVKIMREYPGQDIIVGSCDGARAAAIGMTGDDVSRSRWGLPNHINTTETATGVTAQWVYDDGPFCREAGDSSKRGYLYFRNGRLVAIQR